MPQNGVAMGRPQARKKAEIFLGAYIGVYISKSAKKYTGTLRPELPSGVCYLRGCSFKTSDAITILLTLEMGVRHEPTVLELHDSIAAVVVAIIMTNN